MMFLLLTMIMVVAAFVIVATLVMMIMEKSSDIAILKAMGAEDSLIERIFDRFNADPALRAIPVVNNSTPVGLINRYSFIDRFAKPYQRELHGKKPCKELIQSPPLLVEKKMPIQELSHFLAESEDRHFAEGFIITEIRARPFPACPKSRFTIRGNSNRARRARFVPSPRYSGERVRGEVSTNAPSP